MEKRGGWAPKRVDTRRYANKDAGPKRGGLEGGGGPKSIEKGNECRQEGG